MAYIGNTPAEAFSAFQKQDFSTSATTSYTLDHPVSNQNEIALFINFVRQEPTAAYTASGTTLTLTSATSSSDDMYCVYLGKAVQTVNPASGSVGSSQVASTIITGQTAETSIATDDTVLIHDTSAGALRKMTRANFVSGVGGDNTPAFFASLSSNQSFDSTTYTKVQFNAELFDSDNAYDNSTNYRFTVPSGEGGKYVVGVALRKANFSGSRFQAAMRVNGSERTILEQSINTDTYFTVTGNTIMTLSASDYIEVFAYHNDSGSRSLYGDSSQIDTFFYAYKLIGL